MIATDDAPRIDVIVRTLADKAREQQLFRALESIQSQPGVAARPIVVVNGDRYHEPIVQALRKRPGAVLTQLAEASAGGAVSAGRRLVTSPYFMFLDDDDQLVADSLKSIAPAIASGADWDVLITNRYCRSGDQMALEIKNLRSHSVHPLRSLMDENWLSPGASLFRTASISAELLDVGRDHHEWTHIAFRLVLENKRLKFLDVPTAVYNDTAESMSKVLEHHEEELRLFGTILSHQKLDAEIRAVIESKYRNALHTLAGQYARKGEMRKAWRCHLRSLRPPHTFKYLLFSRKLIFPRHLAE